MGAFNNQEILVRGRHIRESCNNYILLKTDKYVLQLSETNRTLLHKNTNLVIGLVTLKRKYFLQKVSRNMKFEKHVNKAQQKKKQLLHYLILSFIFCIVLVQRPS